MKDKDKILTAKCSAKEALQKGQHDQNGQLTTSRVIMHFKVNFSHFS